jgi:O-antigen biosynthesis protein
LHLEDRVEKMKEKKKIVVVLGMHRNGTSVITRGLQVMGVDLGDRLMPPMQGENDKGFWEDLDINSLNIEMLNDINSDWYFLAPIQMADVAFLRRKGYILRAVEILRKKISGPQIFGFKDPRVAKLLPFWKEVFAESGLNVSYVLTIRHPLSVSGSLAKRNGLDAERSYLLWLEHILGSLEGTTGENRVLIDYDYLMQAPDVELGRVAEVLQLAIDTFELEKFKTEFLDAQLRHTVYHINDLAQDETALPLVREMYPELLDAATNSQKLESKTFENKNKQWSNEFSRLRPALTLADKLTIKMNSMSKTIASQELVMQSLTTQITQSNDLIANLQVQIANLQAQVEAIYSSRSWRITAPIRALGSKFRLMKERGHGNR